MRRYVQKIIVLLLISVLLFGVLSGCAKIEQPDITTEISNLLQGNNTLDLIDENKNEVTTLYGRNTAQSIMEKITFELGETAAKRKRITCPVTFSYPDMNVIIEEYSKSDNDDFTSFLEKRLEEQYPVAQKETTLIFTYENDEWSLIVTNELYNILMGGAFDTYVAEQKELYSEIVNAFGGK